LFAGWAVNQQPSYTRFQFYLRVVTPEQYSLGVEPKRPARVVHHGYPTVQGR
jgi:hypothetical protein